MLHAVRGAIAVFVAKATKSFTRLRIKVSERIFGVRISLYFVLCVPVGLCLCQEENTWDNNCWGGEIKELILLPSFIFGLQHMRQGVPVTRQLLISCIEKRNPGIDNRKTTTTKKNKRLSKSAEREPNYCLMHLVTWPMSDISVTGEVAEVILR